MTERLVTAAPDTTQILPARLEPDAIGAAQDTIIGMANSAPTVAIGLSLAWAVAVSVATDFLAYLPTFHHAWRRPGEEPWLPYAMFGAAALVLFVADFRVLAGVIYPAYLFAADAAMVIMILASPHRAAASPSASRWGTVPAEPPMRLSAGSAQWRPLTGKDWRQPDLMPPGGSGGRPPRSQQSAAAGAGRLPLASRAAEPTSW
jgi:hypothetical protein